jgi:hypothetical protein
VKISRCRSVKLAGFNIVSVTDGRPSHVQSIGRRVLEMKSALKQNLSADQTIKGF